MSFSSLRLNPSDIRDGQSSIKSTFTDDRISRGISLHSTMKQLLVKQITPEYLPCIEVVLYKNNYYATDGNRRLFLYKKLESAGLLRSEIPVLLSSTKVPGKITTQNEGRFIKIRGRRELEGKVEAEINYMVKEHLQTEYDLTSSDDEYTDSENTDSEDDEQLYGSLPLNQRYDEQFYGSLPPNQRSDEQFYGSLPLNQRSDEQFYGSLPPNQRYSDDGNSTCLNDVQSKPIICGAPTTPGNNYMHGDGMKSVRFEATTWVPKASGYLTSSPRPSTDLLDKSHYMKVELRKLM